MLEHYLRAPPEFRDIAIIHSKYYIWNRDIVLIELAKAHIAGCLIDGVSEGRPERLGKLSAGAGAGGGIINNDRNLVETSSPASNIGTGTGKKASSQSEPRWSTKNGHGDSH